MRNARVELQGKCRRIFFAKVDIFSPDALADASPQHKAGDILGVASGGGAIDELEGDDLVIATFNDHNAPTRIGCIEEFFSTLPPGKPLTVDLTKASACHDAVAAHRAATKAESDFVFEKGIKLFGSEQPTTAALRHTLKVQEMHTRDDSNRVPDHDSIVQAQTDLEALCKTCDDCCEQLLVTRDAAITFAEPAS